MAKWTQTRQDYAKADMDGVRGRRAELSREEWLAWHLDPGKCSASEAVTILGQNPWTSPYTLAAWKLGKEEPLKETAAMRAGHAMEPVIAQEYESATGDILEDPGDYTVYIHPMHDWLYCTPDRIHPGIDPGVVELKNTVSWRTVEGWGEGPSLSHQIQVQCQIACMGFSWGVIAGLAFNRDLYMFRCERNDEFIELMIRIMSEFRDTLMRGEMPDPGDMPAASTSGTLSHMHPAHAPGALVALQPGDIEQVAGMEDLKLEISDLQERLKAMENIIKARIGDAQYAHCGGDLYYSWMRQTRKGSADTQRMDKIGMEYLRKPDTEFRVLRKAKRPN